MNETFYVIFKQRALVFVRTDTIFQAPFCPKHDAKWANNIQYTFLRDAIGIENLGGLLWPWIIYQASIMFISYPRFLDLKAHLSNNRSRN